MIVPEIDSTKLRCPESEGGEMRPGPDAPTGRACEPSDLRRYCVGMRCAMWKWVPTTAREAEAIALDPSVRCAKGQCGKAGQPHPPPLGSGQKF